MAETKGGIREADCIRFPQRDLQPTLGETLSWGWSAVPPVAWAVGAIQGGVTWAL